MDWLPQIGIGLFGVLAIFLVSTKGRWQRWGYISGYCSQPFWIWTTIANRQWGILILSVLCTVSWVNGVRNHFGKGRR